MKFEWDENKNNINKIKHGISFQDAETVFDDDNAIILFDEQHSDSEDRFIIIGRDSIFRELTVCHCYRKQESIIRIISARKATKTESKLYKGGGTMKDEYTAADFVNSVKNPYFSKLNRKAEVAVRHELYKVFSEIGEKNGVEAEVIMSRCLADYAKKLQESDDCEMQSRSGG